MRASAEAFLRELGQARVLVLRGRHAPGPAEIRERHSYELGRRAIDVVLDEADLEGTESPAARSARVLLGWLVRLQVQQVCAPMDEWIARWTASAVVRTSEGRAIPFADVDYVIARDRDRAARLHLDAARVDLIERNLVPTMRERAARERDVIESLGLADSMLDAATRLSGADFTALGAAAREALSRSADAYRDSLGERLHRLASIGVTEARPADLAAAVSLGEFDGAFPRSLRSLTMRRLVAEMGLDPDAGGRLRIEPSLLPESPPVEIVPLEVPREVRVMLGDDDGYDGYRRALQALGRALGMVHIAEDAHCEHRWLGDPAASQLAGLTLRSALIDAAWLARYAGVTRGEAEAVVRRAALAALHELRHALAMLIYHIEVVDAGLAAGGVEELYVETVGAALGVRPHRCEALRDAPPLLYPAARVQAWQGASVLGDAMVERFDEDWYRNPRAGPWLVQSVLTPARGEMVGEVVKGATGREPSLIPYIERLERLLSS